MLFPPRKETELMGEIDRPRASSKAMTEQAFFSKEGKNDNDNRYRKLLNIINQGES